MKKLWNAQVLDTNMGLFTKVNTVGHLAMIGMAMWVIVNGAWFLTK